MKLIVISNSHIIDNESYILTRLFEAGLETLHLRKHKLSNRKTRDLLKSIPSHFHNRIILHSHYGLIKKFKLKGIHLTRTYKKNTLRTNFYLWFLRFYRRSLIISTSFSNIGSLFEDQPFNYNYVFLSPVFDNLDSKFQGGFTEHSLRSAMSKTPLPVIARGGIGINNIEKARELNFSGIAFYTAIWSHPEPIRYFNEVIKKFEELKIPIE